MQRLIWSTWKNLFLLRKQGNGMRSASYKIIVVYAFASRIEGLVQVAEF
jgi:hypothetical protein